MAFKTIDDPNAVQTLFKGTLVQGINNNGELVGLYNTNSGVFGFYEIGGIFTTLPDPSPGLTKSFVASGVNDAGQIVGEFDLLAGGYHGYLYSGGTYTVIDDPNALVAGGTACNGINDLGQIVGSYNDPNAKIHGFRYSGGANGTYTTIDVPTAQYTAAQGINDSGEIVGVFEDNNGAFHGFTYINGTYATLDDPLATGGTYAYGINDLGQIVGKYADASGQHGFLYSGGVYTTVDDPSAFDPNGLMLSEAFGINNAGQMAGFYFDTSSTVHGYQTVAPLAKNDFGGDGRSDMLWRNANGTLAEWEMNGAAISTSGYVTYQGNAVAPDQSWSVAATTDFNGDGHADVLWRSNNGSLALWQMNGSVISSSSGVSFQGKAVAPDQSWSVAGTGDFSGDGKSDVLWRQDSSGALALWTMNGSTITSSAGLTYHGKAVTPDASWSVAGIGDFDGNGDADILWRQDSSGSLAIWSMNGATVKSGANLLYQGNLINPDASWSIAGVGDFSGDGNADILWRQDSTGSLAMWLMNGSTVTSSSTPMFQGQAISPDASWKVVEIGDFNGDGSSDILWRNDNGSMAEWMMNGAQVISSGAPSSQGNPVTPDVGWNVQAKPTNFA